MLFEKNICYNQVWNIWSLPVLRDCICQIVSRSQELVSDVKHLFKGLTEIFPEAHDWQLLLAAPTPTSDSVGIYTKFVE